MKYSNDNTPQPMANRLLRWLATLIAMLLLGLFIDWLALNLLLGCCEGGVCWPDFYADCRNDNYKTFYGDDYGQHVAQ